MRKHLILSAAAALVLGGQALADDMNYTYVQGNLLGSTISNDGGSTDGNGGGMEASMLLGGNLFASADLETVKYSESGTSLRFTSGSFGLGGYLPLGANLDLVSGVSFERLDAKYSDDEFGSDSESFNGWGIRFGLRGRFAGKWQWDAGVKYRDIKDLQSIISVPLNVRYYFTPAFALGAGLTYNKYDKDTLASHESVAAISVRYEFGRHP